MGIDVRIENGERVIKGWNAVFKALAAEPRRQLIVSLLDAPSNQPVPLPESAVNPNVPADPEELRQELHHQHLPMLADQKFINWETEPLTATRGSRFDQVATVFKALHEGSADIPDSLIIGCQRLEREQEENFEG